METPNQPTVSESDLREKSAVRLIDFIEKTGLYNKVQELSEAKNINEVLSFEEFRDFLIRVNGIIRGIKIKDRAADGENIVVKGFVDVYRLPKLKDKEDLLLQTYEALDKVDKNDLKYFIPLMITAIHLFEDGNGRTSRVFNVLLNNFNHKDDMHSDIRKSLGIDGRYDYKDINPQDISFDIIRLLMNQEGISFEDNQWPPILPPEFFGTKNRFMFTTEPFTNPYGKRLFEFYNHDSELVFLSIFKYLKGKDLLVKCIETNNELGGVKALSPALMEFFLTETDLGNIINGYFDLLKERVKILIDSFINPTEHTLIDGSMTIKDKILKSIKQ